MAMYVGAGMPQVSALIMMPFSVYHTVFYNDFLNFSVDIRASA
jgi:hypothetical protein